MKKALSLFLSLVLIVGIIPAAQLDFRANAAIISCIDYFAEGDYSSNQGQYVANIAKAQLGKDESDLPYSYDWCSYFATDCAWKAGVASSVVPRRGYAHDLVEFFMTDSDSKVYFRQDSNYFNGSFLYKDHEPQPGDIIGVCNDGNYNSITNNNIDGNYSKRYCVDHIGLVWKVDRENGWIYTIEGNTSDAVNSYRYRWNNSDNNGLKEWSSTTYIQYVCHPNYQGSTTHVHSYERGYEGVHPHRVYMRCNCGDWYYTGENAAVMQGGHYEAAHPHRCYEKCSLCDYWSYTGETTTMPGCIECSRPNKASFIGLQSSYEEGENVTFNWSATTNTTHYNLVIERENDDGSYRTIYRKNYAVSGESVSFGEGYYRASVQSYNSQCWEEDGSDWVHIISDYSNFQVNKPVYSPVITPISDDIVINESTHFIYGLPVGVAQGCVAVTDGTASYEYPTAKQAMGTGTVVNIYNNDNDLVDSYTIVVFGDVDGDSWYDGNDAYFVNLVTNGMISPDALTDAQRMAADCNHDGVIDTVDTGILEQAGLLLNDIDQTAPIEELQTDSVYLEYCGLIDQSIEPIEPDQPTQAEETPAAKTVLGWLKALFTVVLNWLLRIF